ncbi:MAG: DHH family phosphoesterase [Candidatus Spechtbacterales bacterium]|nr:DHH family phosphoesterase [Candidatus Spechtbacterales bacterium]
MRPELVNKFKEVEKVIKASENILIAGHVDSDGDSLGSVLALHHAIKENTDAKTTPYLREDIPPSLKFLAEGESLATEVKEAPDLVIGVDYGDFERLDLPENKIKNAKIITFDHHEIHGQRGDINIIDIGFSSTAEIIYAFLDTVGWRISDKIAVCLATGIMTDTGSFAHQTFPDTFRIAGDLLEAGAPLHDIYEQTIMKPAHVIKAWGDILTSLTLNEDIGLVSAYVPFSKFQKHGIVSDDLEGLKDMLKYTQEASFALLLMEVEPGKIKGSFRSTESKDINVFKIASILGGGGHKYAAAFKKNNMTLDQVYEEVVKVVKEVLEEDTIKV